jgi:hypothetical protein
LFTLSLPLLFPISFNLARPAPLPKLFRRRRDASPAGRGVLRYLFVRGGVAVRRSYCEQGTM